MIGRLGVISCWQDKHVGSQVLNFIKAWFIDPLNKTPLFSVKRTVTLEILCHSRYAILKKWQYCQKFDIER
jgi:hypothetical protein